MNRIEKNRPEALEHKTCTGVIVLVENYPLRNILAALPVVCIGNLPQRKMSKKSGPQFVGQTSVAESFLLLTGLLRYPCICPHSPESYSLLDLASRLAMVAVVPCCRGMCLRHPLETHKALSEDDAIAHAALCANPSGTRSQGRPSTCDEILKKTWQSMQA